LKPSHEHQPYKFSSKEKQSAFALSISLIQQRWDSFATKIEIAPQSPQW
jgi:hypothetical protein